MRILIVTPLYPPDIAGSAPYVKELATRLQSHHRVTVLTYGHIPEEIHGVQIVSVEKRDQLFTRLTYFTKALIACIRRADYIIVENGPSVELPAYIASIITGRKIVFHMYDETAVTHAVRSLGHRAVLKLALGRAALVMNHTTQGEQFTRSRTSDLFSSVRPLPKPEILPFRAAPEEALKAYEASWASHLTDLSKLFTRHE